MHLKVVSVPTVDGLRWFAFIGRQDGAEFSSNHYKYSTTSYPSRNTLDKMLSWKIPEFNQGIIDPVFFCEIGDVEYEDIRPRKS